MTVLIFSILPIAFLMTIGLGLLTMAITPAFAKDFVFTRIQVGLNMFLNAMLCAGLAKGLNPDYAFAAAFGAISAALGSMIFLPRLARFFQSEFELVPTETRRAISDAFKGIREALTPNSSMNQKPERQEVPAVCELPNLLITRAITLTEYDELSRNAELVCELMQELQPCRGLLVGARERGNGIRIIIDSFAKDGKMTEAIKVNLDAVMQVLEAEEVEALRRLTDLETRLKTATQLLLDRQEHLTGMALARENLLKQAFALAKQQKPG